MKVTLRVVQTHVHSLQEGINGLITPAVLWLCLTSWRHISCDDLTHKLAAVSWMKWASLLGLRVTFYSKQDIKYDRNKINSSFVY